jgi:hypothetical protein
LTDPNVNLSLDAVEQCEFDLSDADIVKGYSESPSWIKIEVQSTDRPLFLRLQPTFFDSLTLYWRDPNRWVVRTHLMIFAGPFLHIILWFGVLTLPLTFTGMLIAASSTLL